MFEWLKKQLWAKKAKVAKPPMPQRSFWEAIDEGSLRYLLTKTSLHTLSQSAKTELLYGALSETEARLLGSALSETLLMFFLMERGWQMVFCYTDGCVDKQVKYVPAWMKYPLRLARVRNLLEDGLEDELTTVSALDEDMLDYLTVMW